MIEPKSRRHMFFSVFVVIVVVKKYPPLPTQTSQQRRIYCFVNDAVTK